MASPARCENGHGTAVARCCWIVCRRTDKGISWALLVEQPEMKDERFYGYLSGLSSKGLVTNFVSLNPLQFSRESLFTTIKITWEWFSPGVCSEVTPQVPVVAKSLVAQRTRVILRLSCASLLLSSPRWLRRFLIQNCWLEYARKCSAITLCCLQGVAPRTRACLRRLRRFLIQTCWSAKHIFEISNVPRMTR